MNPIRKSIKSKYKNNSGNVSNGNIDELRRKTNRAWRRIVVAERAKLKSHEERPNVEYTRKLRKNNLEWSHTASTKKYIADKIRNKVADRKVGETRVRWSNDKRKNTL